MAFLFQGRLEDFEMSKKPTYEELNQTVNELKGEATDRKRAALDTQEALEYAENIVETVREPLVVLDADLTVMSVNRSFCQTFEVTPEEIEGQLIYELGDFQWDIPALRELLEDILPRKTSFDNFEVEHDFKKIGRRIMLLNARRIYRPTNQIELILLAIEDVTERKRLEAQLRQAQRMEAVGSLAGGIAHDFNNLLMAIQGNTSLMLLDTDTIHPHHKKLKNIQSCIQSGAELTRQLLGFAGGGKYEPKPTNLNEIVKRATRMLGLTKKQVKIHTKYQKDIWTVEADQGQIVQVLLNIYMNAYQAMPGGGNLYLQTENVTLDEDYVEPSNAKPGKYVKISITDTGLGMEEATHERIFDPFFTTKDMGKGAGFGLPSAYGIIKNHGGIINVFSEKGEGTTFDIYLPALENKVTKQQELPGKALKGKENVLLVDDEDMIIDVGQEMLKTLGHGVFTARSGREAIGVYEANKDKIDIVILDMIMPEMGGGEVFDRMKEINPNIKVLLSTGYSIDGQAKEILARGCLGFMQKPFNLKDLSQKLREILDLDRSLI
jgi:PAS domain S-box-containing protein